MKITVCVTDFGQKSQNLDFIFYPFTTGTHASFWSILKSRYLREFLIFLLEIFFLLKYDFTVTVVRIYSCSYIVSGSKVGSEYLCISLVFVKFFDSNFFHLHVDGVRS